MRRKHLACRSPKTSHAGLISQRLLCETRLKALLYLGKSSLKISSSIPLSMNDVLCNAGREQLWKHSLSYSGRTQTAVKCNALYCPFTWLSMWLIFVVWRCIPKIKCSVLFSDSAPNPHYKQSYVVRGLKPQLSPIILMEVGFSDTLRIISFEVFVRESLIIRVWWGSVIKTADNFTLLYNPFENCLKLQCWRTRVTRRINYRTKNNAATRQLHIALCYTYCVFLVPLGK